MSVAVIGAGAFGTALAVNLAGRGQVTLWGRDTGWARGRENPRLPGIRLPAGMQVTNRIDMIQAETLLLALPAQVLGGFLAEHGARLGGRRLVNCAKGIDLATLTTSMWTDCDTFETGDATVLRRHIH